MVTVEGASVISISAKTTGVISSPVSPAAGLVLAAMQEIETSEAQAEEIV